MALALLASLGLLAMSLPAAAQPRPLFQEPQQRSLLPQDGPPVVAPEITVRELDAPSGNAAGMVETGDLSHGWSATPAAMIGELLAALPIRPKAPTTRQLQVELLQLPTPESDPPGSLLAIRLQRLLELGEAEEARAVLDGSGASEARSTVLAPVVAELELVTGRDTEACDAVAGGLGSAEINLFCAIQAGDLDAALVLQNALVETDAFRAQPFAALVGAALGYGGPDRVDWSAEARPVDLALARQLGVELPDEAATQASLPAVERMAADPGAAPTLRAAARARLAEARGDFTTTGAEATRLRAVPDPLERARALVALWRETDDPAMRLGYLPQLAPLAATIAPRVALSDDAVALAAILIASGQEGAALVWFDMLETQGQAFRLQADRAAALMVLAGLIEAARLPPSPTGLFGATATRWLAAGLAGQGIPLAAPWRTAQPRPQAPADAAPAATLARALVDLESSDTAVFARGLAGLVASDHQLAARTIARSTVAAHLDG